MPTSDHRRTLIADTVIQVLADQGSRGLTHRAVDEAAGLPTGSTSYYQRSRADLLACAVPRLAELDGAVLLRMSSDDPVRLVTDLVVAGSRGAGRVRTLARYELVLEAVRRPALRAALAAGTDDLLTLLRDALSAHPDAPDAEAVLAFVDGLLLAQVTRGPSGRWRRDDLEAAVRRFVVG